MKKILLIDDSLTVRMELRAVFEQSEFELREAADGEEAIESFTRDPDLDLIICDYNMPGLDGLSTIEKIFEIQPERKVSCIMLTTESSSELKERGKAIGIKGWILKPFKKEMLLLTMTKN